MATPHVNNDTFICGNCQKYFNDLVNFLEHKRSTACGVKITYTAEESSEQQSAVSSSGLYVSDGSLPSSSPSSSAVKIVKKRGRPSKANTPKNSPSSEKEPIKNSSEQKTAIIGDDGSMTCDKCKQKFKRERHFKSHKCRGIEGDLFVKPEDIPELEDGFDSRIKFPVKEQSKVKVSSEENVDQDETEDYKPNVTEVEYNEEEEDEMSGNDSEDGKEPKRKKTKLKSRRKIKKAPKKMKPSVTMKRLIATYPIPQTLDDIPDVPVFPNEEARLEFEKKEITVVDLSQTDSMYKTHVIEQTMNENAFPLASRSHTEISLFSCNQCEKVFKSLSHIRYHCLTHIDSKPFKCPEEGCNFRANCKGNIYSHMRKHTGQLYKCRTCDFKSVNKTHLLEHEATHSDVLHKCALCNKDYSTVKSLINHVRKYHANDKEGKDYLAQFIATKEGPGAALLYECHICDRKFKKQSDRDRHLYVHNVRVEHTLFTCELCQYEASKPAFLDSHFIKHKYVYGCELCDQRFVSVQAMVSHISENHGEQMPTEHTHQFTLSEASLQRSLYLPEEKQSVIQALPPGQQRLSSEESSSQSIYERLGYEPMTEQIYNDSREKYGTYECPECGNLYQTEESCDEHMKTHEGERPFTCKYCNHSSYSKNSLKLHINANHEDQLFRCDKCDFVSKGKVTLMEHKQRHEHVACPMCKQIMPGRKALRNHLLAKHGDVDAESARRLSGYGRRTDAMKSGKAFKCPYCEKTFLNNNTELQKHLWTHEGIKPFKCTLCDYSCRTRSNLTSHMLRHTEYKPFPCVVCGKKYKSKTALRWHERSHATGKLFKCDKCNYEATQKSHLVRHLETHNIVKRFSCNHCYFSANTLGYMRIHYTRFHPGLTYVYDSGAPKDPSTGAVGNQPANVYKCVSCDYLFGNLSDMKRHLRMRHRIHIADMRQNKISDTVTQIVPLENQDGITSDVQIIQFPIEEEVQDNVIQNIPTSVLQADHSIIVGDDGELTGAGIQLVELADQTLETGGQQVIVHYTGNDIPVAASNFTIEATDTLSDSQTASDVIIQTSQEGNVTILRTQPGVSLLKSVQLSSNE